MAQSLLRHNPGQRIKELARMLGFFDEFHFSKTFRRVCGVAPRAFRDRVAR